MSTKSTKRVVLAAAAFFTVTAASAQAQLRSITVNVDLREVTGVSPVAPTGDGVVDFVYQTATDYNTDKSITVTNQFRVTSTAAYSIVVRGSGDFTGSPSNTLSLGILRLSAKASGAENFSGEITPTTTNQAIISGATATLDQGYDVLYRIPQTATLLNAAKEVYTTNIIYSATAP
ncbi:hypothetical protein [Niabella beijingensis]|uniref:hypothetical protein n=1 Tax=Niabella beijingensis TaxID=2872700 RepID=UPI001CBB60CE|nr:hypothetical protein [Niabella beijingensis]MBZ4189112.1 hypothetical protein [Niabella beijingensis]